MKHVILPALSIIIFMMGCKSDDRLAPNSQHTPSGIVNPNGSNSTDPKNVQTSQLFHFVPLGDFGGKIDEHPSNDKYPPGVESFATLKRGDDFLQANIHASLLPHGAYVVYWVIFNEPEICKDAHPLGSRCAGHDEEDLYLPSTSIAWATGKVIKHEGAGRFQARLYTDEQRPDQIYLGSDLHAPLENPFGAEVHLIIKHQGEASANPDSLFSQTHSIFGKSYLQLKAIFPAVGQ